MYCPKGRTFSAVDGRCIFAGHSWKISHLKILILLTFDNPDETLTYDAFLDLEKSGFSVNVPKRWEIVNVYIPLIDRVSLTTEWKDNLLNTIHNNTMQRPAKELLLSVYPKEKDGDPSKLLNLIQSRLLEKWTVIIDRISLEASARLYDESLLLRGSLRGFGMIFVPMSMKASDNNESNVFNESNAFLMVLRRRDIKQTVDIINKLYFCRQVELQDHEFVLYSETEPLALMLVKNNRFFGFNEFNLRKNTGGNHKARLCLGDAGYRLLSPTGTARRSMTSVYMYIG